MTCPLVKGTSVLAYVSLRPNALRPRLSITLQLRPYVTPKRPGHGFDHGMGPTPEEVFKNIKTKYPPPPNFKANTASTPRQGLQKYGITPGRLILISIFAYLGYRFYNWQTNPHRSFVLNGNFFTPFLLESKDQVSPTSSIFNLLSVPPGQNTSNIADAWRLGVWSVQVMQPELQIARSYTPLPPNEQSPAEQIRLVVRKEPQGEVSGFLHRLAPGTMVHLRGPHPEYLIPDEIEEVIFLAGGTGIAPALQVAHCLYTVRKTSTNNMPKMHILWANRRREDSFAGSKPAPMEKLRASIMAKVRAGFDFDRAEETPSKPKQITGEENTKELSEKSLLIEEVESLRTKHSDKINVDYFVDEENTFITEDIIQKYLLTEHPTLDHQGGPVRKKLLIISGPDGFVSAFAGPKGMQKGKETQGPIGGILERIDRGAWEVWKL